jgi:hypothetical protein
MANDERDKILNEAQQLARRTALSCIEEWQALDGLEYGELESVNIDGTDFTDAETLREHIQESPLSVSVGFDGWYSPGEKPEPDKYRVLLGWGGPAAGVDGELDVHGQPHTAFAWGQDWGTGCIPCTDLDPEEEEALLSWAQLFWLGD